MMELVNGVWHFYVYSLRRQMKVRNSRGLGGENKFSAFAERKLMTCEHRPECKQRRNETV